MRAVGLVLTVIAAIAGMSSAHETQEKKPQAQQTINRFPESRARLQGEIWLSWDERDRIGFIRGFMTGYEIGHYSGCSYGITLFQSEFVSAVKHGECRQKKLRYNESIATYENQMTRFYTLYPQDRDLPMGRLLTELWSPERKTLEQIHEWLESLLREDD